MPLTINRPRAKSGRTAKAQSSLNLQEVSRVAYELYEKRGCVHGHDLEDWLAAERIVQARQRNGNGR